MKRLFKKLPEKVGWHEEKIEMILRRWSESFYLFYVWNLRISCRHHTFFFAILRNRKKIVLLLLEKQKRGMCICSMDL